MSVCLTRTCIPPPLQLPVDWLGSHNPADFVVHESGWVLTWDEWAALCPQEHYFSTLAQQLAAEFRTQHPQLRLGGPCAGCERCGTSAVAVAESVGTSFAAGLALTLRSEFGAFARFGFECGCGCGCRGLAWHIHSFSSAICSDSAMMTLSSSSF